MSMKAGFFVVTIATHHHGTLKKSISKIEKHHHVCVTKNLTINDKNVLLHPCEIWLDTHKGSDWHSQNNIGIIRYNKVWYSFPTCFQSFTTTTALFCRTF